MELVTGTPVHNSRAWSTLPCLGASTMPLIDHCDCSFVHSFSCLVCKGLCCAGKAVSLGGGQYCFSRYKRAIVVLVARVQVPRTPPPHSAAPDNVPSTDMCVPLGLLGLCLWACSNDSIIYLCSAGGVRLAALSAMTALSAHAVGALEHKNGKCNNKNC